jgi:prolyl-tRNA synthetase
MPDGRALQCGTSHYLGQNFARAFDIRFLDETNELQHPHQTSWGVSTRLLGAIVMSHGDDQGLRLPPSVASTQVVVVPISRKADEAARVLSVSNDVVVKLGEAGLRVRHDTRDGLTPGFKFNDWEMRGVPLRIEIGPRDVASGEVVLVRRDITGSAGKSKVPLAQVATSTQSMLQEIQLNLYRQARNLVDSNTRQFDDYNKLREQMSEEGGGGFADIYWCGNPDCETKIREETRATCRAIPLNQHQNGGHCIVCGEPANERALFAKAY